MRVAVAGSLIFPWSSASPFLPSKILAPKVGHGRGWQGLGTVDTCPPHPWVLQHYLLTDHHGLPALPPSNYGLLLSLPLHFSACLSCCPLSYQLHL